MPGYRKDHQRRGASWRHGAAEPDAGREDASCGPDVSEITLRVDGQAIVYKNDPERWLSLPWPGKDGPAGASVQVRGDKFKDEIKHYGEFAFFRLLAEGGAKPVSPGAVELEAAWNLHNGDTRVVIQFRPPTARHPFRRGFFGALQCPASVLAGGRRGRRTLNHGRASRRRGRKAAGLGRLRSTRRARRVFRGPARLDGERHGARRGDAPNGVRGVCPPGDVQAFVYRQRVGEPAALRRTRAEL